MDGTHQPALAAACAPAPRHLQPQQQRPSKQATEGLLKQPGSAMLLPAQAPVCSSALQTPLLDNTLYLWLTWWAQSDRQRAPPATADRQA